MNSIALSQTYIIVESLDVPFPDYLAQTIHELFPGFEVVDGQLGDPIPDATYRQRLLCNPHTKFPMFIDSDVEKILNQKPKIYSPDQKDVIGRPINIEEDNVGKRFYVIPMLRVRGIREDLLTLQKARESVTGITLKYPNGWDIPLAELDTYLKDEGS